MLIVLQQKRHPRRNSHIKQDRVRTAHALPQRGWNMAFADLVALCLDKDWPICVKPPDRVMQCRFKLALCRLGPAWFGPE